jgi:hypothetical protein
LQLLHIPATHVRTLVKRLGQRFESARRLTFPASFTISQELPFHTIEERQ